MAAAGLILLAAGVLGAVLRPFRCPPWAVPVVAAGVALAAGVEGLGGARRAAGELAGPLGFLLAAIPLAAALDRLGFFESVAALVAGRRGQAAALWLVGAAVVAVLNLDAAVVLLTPLYARIARRTRVPVLGLAFAPAALALLASSFLPVSNLTNLIAVGRLGTGSGAFLGHLGLPSVAACGVGLATYRRTLRPGTPAVAAGPGPDPAALRLGALVLAGLLTGFLVGGQFGVPPWAVVAGADGLLIGLRRFGTARTVPWQTALLALALAVLAEGAAVHLGLDRWATARPGLPGAARAAGVAALAANGLNNLPALLVLLPGLHRGVVGWAALLGVNMGPSLLVTGSLSSLIWQEVMGRLGEPVTARGFTRLAAPVVLPAFAAALVVLLVQAAVTGAG